MEQNTLDSLSKEYPLGSKSFLRVQGKEICYQTRFRKTTIKLSDVQKLVWNGFGSILIFSRDHKIDFFDTMIRDMRDRKEVVLFLRKTVPIEKQFGWKNYCCFVEDRKEWKQHRKPDPQSQFCVTRDYYNRWIPWLILTSIILLGISGRYYYLHQKHPEDLLLSKLWSSALFLSLLGCFIQWGVWLLLRLHTPKNGVIMTKFTKETSRPLIFALCTFLGFIILSISLLKLAKLFNVGDDTFVFVFLILLIGVGSIIMIPTAVREHRKYQQRMAEMPDDYIPEILKTTEEEQH